MKKSVFMLIAMVLTLLLVVGCGGEKQEKKAEYKPTVKKVVATYVQAPLNVPSIVQKERKSFEDAYKAYNLPFEYSTITSGADQTAALASGDIQLLNCVGGSSVLISAAAGADIKIISVYANAPKAFKLFSKDDNIKNPADLKGKTIAGPKGTILHELLAAYLKKGGLSMKDVKFVSMGLPAARAAVEAGKVDAALQAGPLAYTAEKAGLHIVTNGEGLVSGLTVTATSSKFYKENKPLVDEFLKVQKSTLKYMQENKAEAMKMTAKATQLKPEAVEAMYPLYDFNPEIKDITKQNLKETQEFLVSAGIMQKKVDVDKLFF
ncbi:MAG: aliphatic sulfonate ABC transporter substrate-binding protein [Phascolarctobacterium sp.]|nr:aliphatic sulfonate ABC transporter substrate-binding protein [Phascolarctobacterium sp.]